MDNIVFKRNYMGEEHSLKLCINENNAYFISESARDYIHFQTKIFERLPKIIIEKDKETFERVVPKLDKFTQDHSGIIEATVDYKKWDSHIIMLLPFMEFDSKDDFELFSDITQNSHSFSISVTDEGLLRVYILINYFDEIVFEDEKMAELVIEVAEEIENEKL